MHRGQAETGIDALAVDQDGAGSTLAVVTPLFRASHAQVVTQEVEQCYPGIDLQLMRLAVDCQAASDRMRNSGFVIAGLRGLDLRGWCIPHSSHHSGSDKARRAKFQFLLLVFHASPSSLPRFTAILKKRDKV